MKPNPLPPDEAAIESLLRDFFQAEIPASLPSPAGNPTVPAQNNVVAATQSLPRRRNRLVVTIVVASLAAVALLAAPWHLLTGRDAGPSPSDAFHAREMPAGERRSTGADSAEPVSRPLLVREHSADAVGDGAGPLFILEGSDTAGPPVRHVPVEERAGGMRNVSIGERPPVAFPDGELRIEILPPNAPVEPRLTPEAPPDARLPEQRSQ